MLNAIFGIGMGQELIKISCVDMHREDIPGGSTATLFSVNNASKGSDLFTQIWKI